MAFCYQRHKHTNNGQAPLPSQSNKTAKEKEDAQKLVPICARDSDEVKESNGTQWKYGQFHVKGTGPDGNLSNEFLPVSRLPKETGLTMHFKFRGGSIFRKLIIEFKATLDRKAIHGAFLEFHVLTHVTGYELVDMPIKERLG